MFRCIPDLDAPNELCHVAGREYGRMVVMHFNHAVQLFREAYEGTDDLLHLNADLRHLTTAFAFTLDLKGGPGVPPREGRIFEQSMADLCDLYRDIVVAPTFWLAPVDWVTDVLGGMARLFREIAYRVRRSNYGYFWVRDYVLDRAETMFRNIWTRRGLVRLSLRDGVLRAFIMTMHQVVVLRQESVFSDDDPKWVVIQRPVGHAGHVALISWFHSGFEESSLRTGIVNILDALSYPDRSRNAMERAINDFVDYVGVDQYLSRFHLDLNHFLFTDIHLVNVLNLLLDSYKCIPRLLQEHNLPTSDALLRVMTRQARVSFHEDVHAWNAWTLAAYLGGYAAYSHWQH